MAQNQQFMPIAPAWVKHMKIGYLVEASTAESLKKPIEIGLWDTRANVSTSMDFDNDELLIRSDSPNEWTVSGANARAFLH